MQTTQLLNIDYFKRYEKTREKKIRVNGRRKRNISNILTKRKRAYTMR